MEIINRSAAIIYSKEKMVEWINKLSIMDGEEKITLEEVNAEPCVILIPEFEDEENAYLFIEEHKVSIFENMLLSWLESGEIDMNLEEENFNEWFDVLLSPIVNDMTETKIEKERIES